MTQWVNRAMMAVFFLALGGFLVWSAMHRPRVFVLQSYSTDYSWTRDVDGAIRKVLTSKPYDVKYHYMDTKRHSDPEFKRIAGALARNRINEWKPDVLIAVDDNAQSLVAICYMDPKKGTGGQLAAKDPVAQALFGTCYGEHPKLDVVFAGIGAEPEHYGYGDLQDNVTGIVERIDIPALKETLRIIARRMEGMDRRLRVVAPIDDSTSGKYNAVALDQLKTEVEPMEISIDVQRIESFPEWRAAVEKANANADLLLFSNYHTVRCKRDPSDPRQAPPAKLIEWTEANSRIPGIGAWGFYVEDGGMLSVGVSPYEQGETAARLAVEILDHGVEPRDLAVETTRQSLVLMREPLMRYYGLELPRIYEAFARATGNFHECSGCVLRSTVASDGNAEGEMIRKFRTEFEPKKKECAVLIVRVTDDPDRLAIAGFSDAGEFRTVVIDDPSHELSKELKKEPTNKDTIVQLATSYLGRTHGDCRQDILKIIESKKRERRVQSTVCADDTPDMGG